MRQRLRATSRCLILAPSKGNVEVPDSVYYWLNNLWSLKGFMMRNEP